MRRTGFNILFQSTLPAGGATSLEDYFGLPTGVFQSTLPAGGATKNHQNQEYEIQISIHAPRRGSDFVPYRLLWRHWISIHAPRRGSDRRQECKYHSLQDFNPRSPQGERLFDCHLVNPPHAISIHAPRRGSDPGAIATGYGQKFQSTLPAGGATPHAASSKTFFLFQSTLPAGGATINPIFIYDLIPISIHAPRRGSDV